MNRRRISNFEITRNIKKVVNLWVSYLDCCRANMDKTFKIGEMLLIFQANRKFPMLLGRIEMKFLWLVMVHYISHRKKVKEIFAAVSDQCLQISRLHAGKFTLTGKIIFHNLVFAKSISKQICARNSKFLGMIIT